jgi:hypothetical protein
VSNDTDAAKQHWRPEALQVQALIQVHVRLCWKSIKGMSNR